MHISAMLPAGIFFYIGCIFGTPWLFFLQAEDFLHNRCDLLIFAVCEEILLELLSAERSFYELLIQLS